MNSRRTIGLILSLALCLVALVALLALTESPARAQATTRHVAPGGNCNGAPLCYATVQAAVDAASNGDLIKVATGVYNDVHTHAPPPGYPDPPPGGVVQVVYVNRTLTIRGGYDPANGYADPPDPMANPTTLDAGGQGRVLFVSNNVSPWIEGLRLTGGDATGQGGHPYADPDAGGGVYLYQSNSATLTGNEIYLNQATSGGGVYAYEGSQVTLSDNTVSVNTATLQYYDFYGGGGLYLYQGSATVSDNTIFDNWAGAAHGGGIYLRYGVFDVRGNTISGNRSYWDGGGVYVIGDDVTLSNNIISGNRTTTEYGQGGGISLEFCDGLVSGNLITGNTAEGSYNAWDGGGGLNLLYSNATLKQNVIVGNTSFRSGGGLSMRGSDATLENNVIADNQAAWPGTGAGVHLYRSNLQFRHTTLARNLGGDGSALCVTSVAGDPVTVNLVNTIIFSHTLGVTASVDSAVTLEGTLWHTNGTDTGGLGTIDIGTVNVPLDPAFAADGYHLTLNSAAKDAGVAAGVTTDVDAGPRGANPDIGADEFTFPYYLPLVWKQF